VYCVSYVYLISPRVEISTAVITSRLNSEFDVHHVLSAHHKLSVHHVPSPHQVLVALVSEDGDASGSHNQQKEQIGPECRVPRLPPGGLPHRVELQLRDVSARHEAYAEKHSHTWRLAVSVHDVEVTCMYVEVTRMYVEVTCMYVEVTCMYVEVICMYVEVTCMYVEVTCMYVEVTCMYVEVICMYVEVACMYVEVTCMYVEVICMCLHVHAVVKAVSLLC
jgi:hypothetical protein